MRVRVVAGFVGVVLSVSVLGACADPVSPSAPGGGAAPRGPALAAGDAYEVTATDLRPLGLDRTPVDVNERGEMVGACRDRLSTIPLRGVMSAGRAFLWSPAGGYRDLGTLGGAASCAAALSDAGHVAGYSQTADGAVRAFVWTAAGGMRDLGTLPGGAESRAFDVNDAGQVVGSSLDAAGVPRAVVWGPDGAIQEVGRLPERVLPVYPGDPQPQVWRDSLSYATAINNRGQVVGWAQAALRTFYGPYRRPFLWTAAGGVRDLTPPAEWTSTVFPWIEPYDIGDGGTIVGARYSNGALYGLLMDTTGVYLGPAESAGQVVYTGVNGRGQVVGYRPGMANTVALFVDEAGRRLLAPPSTVPSSPYTEAYAHAISDRGEIVGFVRDSTPVRWTVRVTPTEALLVDGNSGRCLDVLGESREPGAGLIIYDCHGRANQRFSYPAAGETGEIRVYAGEGTPLCVDAWGAGTENGTRLVVWTCHGGANQQWTRTADGAFRGAQSGRCVDVLGARTENLTDVWLWDCFGGANQRWDARAPGGAGATLAAAPLDRPTLGAGR